MHTKNYEGIALLVRSYSKTEAFKYDRNLAHLMNDMCLFFERDNTWDFDKAKFLKACGFEKREE